MPANEPSGEEAVDPIDILRQFILAAPPGELTNVLHSLRVLTGDDHLFFEAAPRLCLEHHLRHLTVFTLGAKYANRHESKIRFADPSNSTETTTTTTTTAAAAVDGDDGRVSFLTSRQNHLGTRVRRHARRRGMLAREVAESVDEFFQKQRAVVVCERAERCSNSNHSIPPAVVGHDGADPQQKREGKEEEEEEDDPFADVVPEYGFDTLNHVFFDAALHLYVEIDPIEQLCVRVIPFLAAAASLEMPEVLLEVERQATGLHGGPLGHARFVLGQEVSRYVRECFGAATAASVEATHGTAEERVLAQLMGSARMLIDGRRSATASAGSMVVLQSSSRPGEEREADCHSLVVAVAAVRQFPRNMWSGRWKSLFVVENMMDGGVCIRGETQVYAHYYEEGNMHLEVVRELQPTPLPGWTADIFFATDNNRGGDKGNSTTVTAPDTWEMCAAVMAAIQQHEQQVHDAVLRASRDAGDQVLQELRRRLPVTRQLFDFRRGHALPRPLYTRPGYDD